MTTRNKIKNRKDLFVKLSKTFKNGKMRKNEPLIYSGAIKIRYSRLDKKDEFRFYIGLLLYAMLIFISGYLFGSL